MLALDMISLMEDGILNALVNYTLGEARASNLRVTGDLQSAMSMKNLHWPSSK